MWRRLKAPYIQALKIRPSYIEAHVGLGRLLLKQGRRREAVAHGAEAMWLSEGQDVMHRWVTAQLSDRGLLEDVVDHLQQVLADWEEEE